jgi:hypothetical protein
MKLPKILFLLATLAASQAHAAVTHTAAIATHGGLSPDRVFIVALGAILIVGAWFGRCTSRRS